MTILHKHTLKHIGEDRRQSIMSGIPMEACFPGAAGQTQSRWVDAIDVIARSVATKQSQSLWLEIASLHSQ
jgi:hypothetical protein